MLPQKFLWNDLETTLSSAFWNKNGIKIVLSPYWKCVIFNIKGPNYFHLKDYFKVAFIDAALADIEVAIIGVTAEPTTVDDFILNFLSDCTSDWSNLGIFIQKL